MRTLVVLTLLGSLLSIAPSASACSNSGSIGPNLDETRAGTEDDAQYIECTHNMVRGEIDSKIQGARQFALDALNSWDYRSTLRDLTCGITHNGKPVACLG